MTSARRRVIIASNRVPPPPAEGAPWPVGGLVSALLPPLAAVGGLWFGWSGRAGDPDTPPQRTVTSDIDYVTIDLPEQEVADFYEGFCNRTLWPHLHGLAEQATSLHREYSTYRTANRRFALALVPLLGADDLIWVHDYQLIPLGQELQRLGWRGPLGYFHHVPVPPREHWEAIPNHEALAEAFTAYELIGTQTPRDRDQLRTLLAAGHAEHISTHPVGIDPQRFRSSPPPTALTPSPARATSARSSSASTGSTTPRASASASRRSSGCCCATRAGGARRASCSGPRPRAATCRSTRPSAPR